MSRTLFWYIFKDLLKVFILTAIALAGIMSFGGLLRPLTENGLDGSQVGRMLAYLLPAMATYSLPIAALFATTMVYGRLSSDNEVTACRAGGISFFSIAQPAFLLGLFVAIISLLLLCFIVPVFTFKVEQIIYSNLARLVANKIERNHQVTVEDNVIFAQEAYVPPTDPNRPNEQTVVLGGPMFVRYEKPTTMPVVGTPMAPRVPKRFFMARKATVYITRTSPETIELSATLEDGAQFPREFAGNSQANLAALNFGPVEISSATKEHPKFMPINQLRAVLADLNGSNTVREAVAKYVRAEQDRTLTDRALTDINGPDGTLVLASGGDRYTFNRGPGMAYREGASTIILPSSAPELRQARFRIDRAGGPLSAVAGQVRLTLSSDPDNGRVIVRVELRNAEISTGQTASEAPTGWDVFTPSDFAVPLPDDLRRIERRSPEYYLTASTLSPLDQQLLRFRIVKFVNYVKSEMHGRASFAVSCFVLVLVGSSLGLMFKSGNFLSAFAVSVVPALISIALIVTGQHTIEAVPGKVTAANDPLHLGVAIIWSGNLIVLMIGGYLLAKLQRR